MQIQHVQCLQSVPGYTLSREVQLCQSDVNCAEELVLLHGLVRPDGYLQSLLLQHIQGTAVQQLQAITQVDLIINTDRFDNLHKYI